MEQLGIHKKMNTQTIKKLAGSSALLGMVLSASAQLPNGASPGTAPLPAGLNPNINILGLGDSYVYALPNGGSPLPVGQELFASGGPVYVTDLGPTGASYDEELFVASPNDGMNNLFMDDHSTPNGTTYYLGNYAAGTEIELGLDVFVPDPIWYDGPASRNSDEDVHAYMVNNFEGLADTTYVGFEDATDFNYIDQVFAVTGVSAASAPDMPGTLGLLGMSLTGLAAFGRRFLK